MAGDRNTKYGAAITLALAGDGRQAAALADDLSHRFPEDTFVESCYLPTLRGTIDLEQKDPTGALKELAGATRYEMGVACGLLPVYIRGMAYLQSADGYHAALEFQKIIDHPGVVLNSPIGPLARLELGRSDAISNEPAKARDAYKGIFAAVGKRRRGDSCSHAGKDRVPTIDSAVEFHGELKDGTVAVRCPLRLRSGVDGCWIRPESSLSQFVCP